MNNIVNIKPNMTAEEKAKAYANYFALPFVRLKGKKIDSEILKMVPEDVARQYQIVVYDKTPPAGGNEPITLKIAVADPERLQKKAPLILSQLKKEKGINFQLAVTMPDDFEYALGLYKTQLKPLAQTSKLPKIDLRSLKIPPKVLTKFPQEVALKYQMIVFAAPEGEDFIKVALVDPDNKEANEILNFIKERNHLEIKKYQTSEADLHWALKLYGRPQIPSEVLEEKTTEPSKEPAKIHLKEVPEELEKKPPQKLEKSVTSVEKESVGEAKAKPEEVVLAEKAPEIRSEEVTSEEPLDKTRGKEEEEGEEKIIPIGLAEQEEKNLDNVLPNGIKNTEELTKIIKTGFIPKIVAAIIYLAVKSEASDIHIEAEEKDLRLRYRIDGILRDIMRMPLTLHPPIVSRIKILARLKIDEQRIPQDGRFNVVVDKREIDLRVSTLPTVHGEKVVMRVLDKSSGIYTLEKLGLTGDNLQRAEENINKPYGIILATGPTGSGKSTTLYAILEKISTPGVNVVTLEDPVEYELAGINQCQIKPKIGFGFAEGLRSVVRQDPNIIMVGEIRDSETANLATHAALTGHLVLSTLHTNDAAGALPRLINMGVEPFLITSSINAIIAQRLVRKICPKCKKEKKIPQATVDSIKKEIESSHNKELSAFQNKPLKFYQGKGCTECGQDGYKGRIGLFEILVMTDKIEDLAVRKMPASEIAKEAIKEGMTTIKQDGSAKALQGLTTIDEVLRVTTT